MTGVAQLRELFDFGEEAFAGAPTFFRLSNFDDIIEADRTGNLIVHSEDGKPVGFVALTYDPKTRFAMPAYLVVHPEYRGHGIAKSLLDAVNAKGKELGAEHSVVCVWDKVGGFYRRAGYEQVGVFLSREL
jgi:N-acetylglutamate synthase-like GNAT family acetyltransferase